jgi:hypothetical protein
MKSAGGLVARLITDKKVEVEVEVEVVLRLRSATEVEVESIVGIQSRPSF